MFIDQKDSTKTQSPERPDKLSKELSTSMPKKAFKLPRIRFHAVGVPLLSVSLIFPPLSYLDDRFDLAGRGSSTLVPGILFISAILLFEWSISLINSIFKGHLSGLVIWAEDRLTGVVIWKYVVVLVSICAATALLLTLALTLGNWLNIEESLDALYPSVPLLLLLLVLWKKSKLRPVA